MKILILNWRDIKNPASGGAETVTFEIAKYFIKHGHEVTWFAASFKSAPASENLDGVKIIRAGSQTTVHIHAFIKYLTHFRGQFDLILEEINTLPFLTPLYAKEKKIAYFNQLAREVWFYEAKFPISLIGFLLEPLYVALYRNTQVITISKSCQLELQEFGIKKVSVFPMAIDFEKEQKFLTPKESILTLIYVGRIVPSKRVLDVIECFNLVLRQVENAQLWIVGNGDESYTSKVTSKIKKLGLDQKVELKGRVSDEEKFRLMSRAHLILVTSIKEGWGLIVSEANGVKTPAVVYDVSGLRDAVRDQETGIVCKQGSPQSMAEEIITLVKDRKKYATLQTNAYNWSKELTWENTGRKSLEIIEKVLGSTE